MIQILTEDPSPPAPTKPPMKWGWPRVVKEAFPWSMKTYGGMLYVHKENLYDRPFTAIELRQVAEMIKQMADELDGETLKQAGVPR